MTEQQLEEKKAEQEVFSRLRAIRRKNRKLREIMGNDAYDDYVHNKVMASMEAYCRANPGTQIVKVGHGYMLKDIVGTTQP